MDYSELRNYQVDNIETLFYANKNLRDVFLEVEDFASELHIERSVLYEKFMKIAAKWDGYKTLEPIHGKKNHPQYVNDTFIRYIMSILISRPSISMPLNKEKSKPLDMSADLLPKPRIRLDERISHHGYDYKNFDDLLNYEEYEGMRFSQKYK
ncbi:MAG: hypothetical protein KAS12_01265 [Candidatus Aenigmarchaeota archaeon]|nr:hypothetical protein [Candidatus Aenigmarchaeota archaeon]